MAYRLRTFAIIKPDAVEKGVVGSILHIAEECGLVPERMAMGTMAETHWRDFYREHKGRDFFEDLITFMISGPSVFIVFRAKDDEVADAIQRWRDIMGSTNPKNADRNTIRGKFGTEGPANAVHGSDSVESFRTERTYFSCLIE